MFSTFRGYGREDLLAKTCYGEIRNQNTLQPQKCHFLHNFNPYLKLGPFQLEIFATKPYRVVFHDFLTDNEINHIVEISLPNLSNNRGVSLSNFIGTPHEYRSGERLTAIHKTVQYCFNGKSNIISLWL